MNEFRRIDQKVMRKATRISGTVLFLAMLNVLLWMPTWAAPNAVVGTGTPASCTEAALLTALDAGGDVTFNCGNAAHTITLTSAKTLSTDVNVDGGGLITLSGGNTNSIFTVANGTTVTLRRITLVNASNKAVYNSGTLNVINATFLDNAGGAIYSAGGTTVVLDSTFERNSAGSGGAITNENEGTLSITGSTFRNNSITGSNWGGAVFNSSSGIATVADSVFEGNLAAGGTGGAINNSNVMTIENTLVRDNIANGGGGIYNNGDLIVVDSHVTSNTATGAGGGGITHFNQSTTPSKLTLIRSTVDSNLSQQGGGGIWFSGEDATLEAVNSTLYSNTASTIGGGGLLVQSAVATLTNVTIHNNTSLNTEGDDVENSQTFTGTVTLENTLVVGGGCSGAIVDGNGNLEFPGASCGFAGGAADPGLGELANNGGWTPTMAITEGGPAQNAAVNANCPATDQRGVLRPQFTTCDIGAFEWGALPVLTSIAPTSTLALSPTFTLVVNGSNFIAGTPASRVLWNGVGLPTTYVSSTELRATVANSLIVAGGQVSVTVETLVVDGGISDHTEIFTIIKRDQTINFDELADRPADPLTFNVTATASSGLPVSFTASGECTIAGSTVTLTGDLGTCTITAAQAGDQSYKAAPNVVRSFEVINPELLHLPHLFGNK